jgi:hypothetical protein
MQGLRNGERQIQAVFFDRLCEEQVQSRDASKHSMSEITWVWDEAHLVQSHLNIGRIHIDKTILHACESLRICHAVSKHARHHCVG